MKHVKCFTVNPERPALRPNYRLTVKYVAKCFTVSPGPQNQKAAGATVKYRLAVKHFEEYCTVDLSV